MKTQDLTPTSFQNYPTQGRELALQYLPLLERAPLPILPTLLEQLCSYDWSFPAQQREIEHRLKTLHSHPEFFDFFDGIMLPDSLTRPAILHHTRRSGEILTAHLWSTHQMDAFRDASTRFVKAMRQQEAHDPLPLPRLMMVAIGKDAAPPVYLLFEKLHSHGQLLSNLQTEDVWPTLQNALHSRASSVPATYTHWYLDGGDPLASAEHHGVTLLSYSAIAPVNRKVLAAMHQAFTQGTGPEVLRTRLNTSSPSLLDADQVTADPRMQRFIVSALTEASGTQLFSTTFVQWAGREILRQAQPLTMLIRFTPRQVQLSFNSLAEADKKKTLDPAGSLIDADMAAWYLYLELIRLDQSDNSRLLVWFEGQRQALICGPGVPAATTSDRLVDRSELSRFLNGI